MLNVNHSAIFSTQVISNRSPPPNLEIEPIVSRTNTKVTFKGGTAMGVLKNT